MIASMTRAAINTIKDIDTSYNSLSLEYDTLPVRLQKLGPAGWVPSSIIHRLYSSKNLLCFNENNRILIRREASKLKGPGGTLALYTPMGVQRPRVPPRPGAQQQAQLRASQIAGTSPIS